MAMYAAQVITAGGVSLSWGGEAVILPQGCTIELLSGGALETAIGLGNLAAVSSGDPDSTGDAAGGGEGGVSN
jgi:hypothetical protein